MINLRASMLPSFPDCPRRSAAKQWPDMIVSAGYELRQLERPIGTAVGDGGHEIARLSCIAKRDGIALSEYDAIDAGIEKFRDSAATGAIYDETTSSRNDAEKQVQRVGTDFIHTVLPQVAPNIIECKDRENALVQRAALIGNDVMITMHPDLETVDNTIEDWKFGKLFPYCIPQLGGYSLGKQSNGSAKPDKLRMWHLPRVSLKKTYPGAQVYKYDVALCEKAAFAAILLIVSQVRKFQQSNNAWAFPANPMSMLCSDKYCPAWGTNFCEVGKCL